jgi:hypothetical protein
MGRSESSEREASRRYIPADDETCFCFSEVLSSDRGRVPLSL